MTRRHIAGLWVAVTVLALAACAPAGSPSAAATAASARTAVASTSTLAASTSGSVVTAVRPATSAPPTPLPATTLPAAATPATTGSATATPEAGATLSTATTSSGATGSSGTTVGATGTAATFASIPATATPAADQSLSLLQESFTLLTEKFFRPLNSKDLLTVAWQAATAEARREGGQANVAAPQLTGNATADLAAFSEQYLQLVAGLSGTHSQVAFAAAQQMASSLHERHTYFLTPTEAQQFTAESSGQSTFVGVGVTFNAIAAPFLVADVFPNSPAAAAGITPGDEIVSVNGKSMTDATSDQLTAALSGPAGQSVMVTVKPPTGAATTVTLTRRTVFQPILESRVLADHMCYIQLHNFPFADQVLPDGETVLQELDADLTTCQKAQVTGWIVDLRGDPGGADVERFASRFIADGVLSTSKDRVGATYEMAPTGHLFSQQLPLAVLVDGGSASSSEIFASAVQDLHRGIVVGTHSAGIVNGTEIIPLPLGAELGVAVEQVLRDTSGTPLDGHGVTPDVVVSAQPSTAEQLAAGTDNQIARAAQALAAATAQVAVPPQPTPTSQLLTNQLQLLSNQELQRRLGPLLPGTASVPTTTNTKRADLMVSTLDGYASESPNLAQAKARALRLGFRGEIIRRYGPVDSPDYTIGIALYANAQGAHDDLALVYQPGEQQNPLEALTVTPPATFGDETVARVGTGPNAGSTQLTWRHGNVDFDIEHDGNPGDVPFSQMVSVAKAMEALYAQHPVQ